MTFNNPVHQSYFIRIYNWAKYDCKFPDSKAFFLAKTKTKKTFNLK